jgi:hypothetical protein
MKVEIVFTHESKNDVGMCVVCIFYFRSIIILQNHEST